MQAKIILGEFMKSIDFEIPAEYKLRMVKRFAFYEPFDVLALTLTKKERLMNSFECDD